MENTDQFFPITGVMVFRAFQAVPGIFETEKWCARIIPGAFAVGCIIIHSVFFTLSYKGLRQG